MSQTTTLDSKKTNFKNLISGIALVAGTSVGGGMLGIPYVTSSIGFLPACFITIVVWAFMLCTGLLFLEATLASPSGANVFTITEKSLGFKWKLFTGFTFLFLYYSFMVAYFSGIIPTITSLVHNFTQITLPPWGALSIFLLIFGSIVALGLSFVDKINFVLMIGLICSFTFIIGSSSGYVQIENLKSSNWPSMIFATPILFGAFGYHNIIPSLADYFDRKKSVLYYSIILGTIIPLIIYLLWQWSIIGILPKNILSSGGKESANIINLVQKITKNNYLSVVGQAFWFFCIVTSFLGVSFSLMDFLGDVFKKKREGKDRLLLCFLTFFPPFLVVLLKPDVFLLALGIAGGIGEAFINGLIPIWMVWALRCKNLSTPCLLGGKKILLFLTLIGFSVVFIEIFSIIKH